MMRGHRWNRELQCHTGGRGRGTNGEDGIYNISSELFRERRIDFGGEGSVGNVDEGWTIKIYWPLEFVKELAGEGSGMNV